MKLSTQLNDRELRFDGVSIVSPDKVVSLLLRGVPPSKIRVTDVPDEIQLFNSEVSDDEQLLVSQDETALSYEWLLPEEYAHLDIYERVGRAYEEKLPELYSSYSQKQYDEALDRIALEMREFEKRGMTNFLRTIIYVVDVFREKKVVWGVGRGSSCASYVLFLIGLHSVDAVRYGISHTEFFHD